ncbi:histidine phosphotransferase ChpT [Aestuariivirga sp.]|uniref:histidine phosphotransferase ChpT n=1 Tax=Aestuariivirga sp. TaxID=2650926 RepID=UPI0035946963
MSATMSEPMPETMPVEARLSDLDLAALLCSRVCHDVISPVGAIANGLELIDDPEMDEETKETALDMVRSSARTASAKLKFCRIAFGAAGSAGALIDMGEAGEIAKAFVGEEKVKLDWQAPRENRPKQQVKLVLNMLLMAMAGIPRGGVVTVSAEGDSFSARAAGDRAKVPEAIAQVVEGTIELTTLDARLVQPYYAKQLARSAGLMLTMTMDGPDVLVKAA